MNVDLFEVISSLGFPTACVIAMSYFIWNIWKKSNDQNDAREQKLYGIIADAQEQNRELSQTNEQMVNVLSVYAADITKIQSDVQYIKDKIQ
jgi:hypothetical protein